MKIKSTLIDEILKQARNLDLKSEVKLVNGETGYIEHKKDTFDFFKDTAIIEVWFPSRSNRSGTTFISKKFLKNKLTYVGEYDKNKRKEEYEGFRHPSVKKQLINDILEYIGLGEEYVHDVMRYLTTMKRYKISREMFFKFEEYLKEMGFEIKNDKVSKGKVDIQMGLKDHPTSIVPQRAFPFDRNLLDKQEYKSQLYSKGIVQITFGKEFIENSYTISKDFNDLRILQRSGKYKDIFTHDMMMGAKIYQDSDSRLYWLDTGSSD
jgi:hypothetical protein